MFRQQQHLEFSKVDIFYASTAYSKWILTLSNKFNSITNKT